MVKVKNSYGRSIVRILIHSTLWILVLLFFSFTFGADNTINSSVLSFSVFMMPVTIGTTYVAIYLLIPEYFLTKQYFKFGIYSFYCFVLSLFGILLSVFLPLPSFLIFNLLRSKRFPEMPYTSVLVSIWWYWF